MKKSLDHIRPVLLASVAAGVLVIVATNATAQGLSTDAVSVDLSVLKDGGYSEPYSSGPGPGPGPGYSYDRNRTPMMPSAGLPRSRFYPPAGMASRTRPPSSAPTAAPTSTFTPPSITATAPPAPKPITPVEPFVAPAAPAPAPVATRTAPPPTSKKLDAPKMAKEAPPPPPQPMPKVSKTTPPPALPKIAKVEPPKATPKTPPPAAMGSSPAMKETAPGRTAQVIFQGDATRIPAADKESLKALADQIKSQDGLRLQLVAYAGGEGLSSSKARRLSLSRALAIRSYLIETGVRSTRIDVRALGNKTTDEPVNRVDVNITER